MNGNEILRALEVRHSGNKRKIQAIKGTLPLYRETAKRIAPVEWLCFYTTGSFSKFISVKGVPSPLSERYKQTARDQVAGMLESWVSNRKEEVTSFVVRSSLEEQTKIDLLFINKYGKWFSPDEVSTSGGGGKGKKTKGPDGKALRRAVPEETRKLARLLFKQAAARHRKPSFKHINMALDAKVAEVVPADEGKSSHADWWVRVSTAEKGKPVRIPLHTNEYFEEREGTLKKFLFVEEREDGDLTFRLVKSVPFDEGYRPVLPSLSIDFGLCTPVATNMGDLCGQKFYRHLLKMDKVITDLAANLQGQNIKLSSSKRYNRLVKKLRNYFKNELNRILNRLVEVYSPRKIAVEKLDFRSPGLSKKMNRLLRRCGKRYMKEKLQALSEEKGIEIVYVNPAYTSKACPNPKCGYVDKRNRKSRSEFECKYCGKKGHADAIAGKNIDARSSDAELRGPGTSPKRTLAVLTRRFSSSALNGGRPLRPRSWAEDLLAENPYFGNSKGFTKTGTGSLKPQSEAVSLSG